MCQPPAVWCIWQPRCVYWPQPGGAAFDRTATQTDRWVLWFDAIGFGLNLQMCILIPITPLTLSVAFTSQEGTLASARATGCCPFSQAECRGVRPYCCLALTSALNCNNVLAASKCPFLAAKCSGHSPNCCKAEKGGAVVAMNCENVLYIQVPQIVRTETRKENYLVPGVNVHFASE